MARKSEKKSAEELLESLTISVGKLEKRLGELESANGRSEAETPETPQDLPAEKPKVSLESLEQTNGKLPEELEKDKLDKVRKMEQLFDTKSVNAFGTTELSIFQDRLKEMTLADLQNLAYKVGVDQHLQPAQLKNALKNAFIQASKSFGGGLREKPKAVNTYLDPKNEKHLKLMRMMGMATQ